MTRLIISDTGGLWRDFRAPRPAVLRDALGVVHGEPTDLEIYEAGDWANERAALVAATPAANYTVTARTAFEPKSMVTFGFGADEVLFPVPLLRASTVEACLNSMPAVAAAGGVDVKPLEALGCKLSFAVTFRSVGARDTLTMTGQAGQVFTVAESTAGDVATREVQTLTIEQKTVATISTGTAAPAAAISNADTGVWIVTLDERATSGFWTLTVGGTDTEALSVDATADEVRSAILAADDGTGWTVRGNAREGYVLAANEASPPTVTISDTLQGYAGRAGAIDLEPQLQASRITGRAIVLTITKPTTTGRKQLFQQTFDTR